MSTEAQLQHLYQQLTQVFDPEGATTLMELVSPFARDQLATKADTVALRSEMADLRTEMADLRGDLRRDMADLRGGLQTEMAELQGSLHADLAAFKHELTRSLASWMFVSQGVLVGVVGLIVGLS